MRLRTTVAGGACLGLALAGCAATDAREPGNVAAVSSETTSVTTTGNSELPEVTFNPCDELDDEFLLRFDLDPAKRDRHEFSMGRENILACGILGDNRSVSVWAQNTPWDDIPFDFPPEPITINGREAWYAPGGLSDDSCSVLMRTDFGAVIVEHSPRRGGTTDPNMDRCDSIMDIAEAVEPLIDGNN